MCGILGRLGGTPRPLDAGDLRRALGHRGPDGVGLERRSVHGHELLLGHTRLSIVDTSDAGAQPMTSRSGRWLLSFNGEIYNHQELRRDLEGPFESHGDSRTLVEALDQWGVARTVPMLNGIFAFAAVDLVEGRLYLARDPFGVKPLYYQYDGEALVFGSEHRALACLAGEGHEVDREALGQFLLYRYTPSPRTLWKGVHRLAPGHLVEFSPGSLKVDQVPYLKMEGERFSGSVEEAEARYIELLGDAVERQLMSDVPLGILLSGGVDSALVAALARARGGDPTAYTVGFGKDHDECELEYARRSAAALGLRHRQVVLDAESSWAAMAPALSAVEEPLGTTSLIPMWSVSALASEDVKVVLTGQGTDELWGGYRRYQGQLLGPYIPRGRAWGGLAALAKQAPVGRDVLERGFRSHAFRGEADHFAEVHALFTEGERRALGVEVDREVLTEPMERWLSMSRASSASSPVERMMGVDLRTSLPDDLLLYGDRISMAHSVEARVPMLDPHVTSFVESLPRSLRLRIGHTKWLHRRAAAKLLPQEIVRRPKLGFQVPFGVWARDEWREPIEATLLDPRGLGQILDLTMIRKVWTEHLSGRRDRERQVFALVALATWSKRFIGGTRAG